MSARGAGRISMRSRGGLFALALAGLLAGCGEGNTGASTRHELESLVAPAELLQLSISAAKRVPFQAIRRYEVHWRADVVEQLLVYREDAFSDGRGGFALDALDVVEPAMGADEEATFLLLQAARAQFFFGHRDFAIRDERLFLEHWQALDRGATTVAGRACTLLDVQRRVRPDRTYRLAIDGENGLILRAEERDREGALVSLLEYETLDLAPAALERGGRPLFDAGAIERATLTEGALESALSFAPKAPKLLPSGYELSESAAVSEAHPVGEWGGEWAQFTFSDGVDEIFFLHAGGAARGPESLGPESLGSAGLPTQASTIRYLAVGPWMVLFGEVDGDDFVAAGKLAPEALRDLVESAFF